jgi:hypothetical protein
MAGDPRKFAELMRAQGYSDDDIVAALQKVRAQEAPKGHMGRGDELFQPDPSPGGPLVNVERPGLVNYGGFGDQHGVDVMTPQGRGVAALDDTVRGLRSTAAGLGTGEVAAQAIGAALPAAGGAIGRIATAGAQGTASGAAQGATDAILRGEAPRDVGRQAVNDAATGGLMAGGTATVGELLRGLGAGIRNSKGGQARALIEKHGGKVGVFDSGSGIPELDGLGTVTDADIGAQARASGKQLLQANDRMFDQEGRQPYLAARAAIDQDAGKRLVDVTPLRQKMLEVAYDKATDPGTKAWLLNQADIIEQQHAGPMGTFLMSEKDVNGLKSMLQRSANPGLAPGAGSVRDAQISSVAQVAKDIADQGPYAEANRAYAAAKDRSGDFREAFGMNRKPAANEQVDERRIANALARRGQTSTTAGIQGGDARLQQLEQAYPELQRTIAGPALVQAKGDLQFNAGGHTGGLVGRMPSKHLLVDLARQNVPALAGRIAYGPAGAVQGAGQAISGAAVPAGQMLIEAAQRKRQQDAAVIESIFGPNRGKPGPDDKQAPQQQGP